MGALFGGKKFVRDLRRAPHLLAWRIVKDTLRSCGYWVLGVHVCIRLCTCFSRKLIRWMYRTLDSVMGTKTVTKFECCNEKNVPMLLLTTSIIGRLCIMSEPKGRRTEITLSLAWYMAVQLMRKACGLETDDDDQYHWLLGGSKLVSFLLAATVGINVYVFCKDAKYVKSMERNI